MKSPDMITIVLCAAGAAGLYNQYVGHDITVLFIFSFSAVAYLAGTVDHQSREIESLRRRVEHLATKVIDE